MEEDLLTPPAFDTSGMPVNPPQEGFRDLGQVEGTSMSNAYLAELEANRLRSADVRTRIAEANQRAKAEEQAMRLAGQMEYQQLVGAGATPEEALRRTAHKLYFNSPAGLATALRATRPQPSFNPTLTDVEGGRLLQAGPNRAQFIANKAPVMPPEVKAKDAILKNRLKAITSGPLGVAADPKEVAALENAIMENSTNWQAQASGPRRPPEPTTSTTTQPAPFKEGAIIRNKKNGKLYKVVNGQPVEQSE